MTQRYLVVLEGDALSNFSAYSPDLPGVVTTGASREECEAAMASAISFHIAGMREAGDPIPQPSSTSTYVEIDPSAA